MTTTSTPTKKLKTVQANMINPPALANPTFITHRWGGLRLRKKWSVNTHTDNALDNIITQRGKIPSAATLETVMSPTATTPTIKPKPAPTPPKLITPRPKTTTHRGGGFRLRKKSSANTHTDNAVNNVTTQREKIPSAARGPRLGVVITPKASKSTLTPTPTKKTKPAPTPPNTIITSPKSITHRRGGPRLRKKSSANTHTDNAVKNIIARREKIPSAARGARLGAVITPKASKSTRREKIPSAARVMTTTIGTPTRKIKPTTPNTITPPAPRLDLQHLNFEPDEELMGW